MTCYIYLVAHVESDQLVAPVKVGITNSLGSRLKSLQTGNPREIAYACTFAVADRTSARFFEGAFHHIQSEKRMSGEWFDMPVRDALARICFYMDVAVRSVFEGHDDLIDDFGEVSGLYDAMEFLGVRTKSGEAVH